MINSDIVQVMNSHQIVVETRFDEIMVFCALSIVLWVAGVQYDYKMIEVYVCCKVNLIPYQKILSLLQGLPK